jgi:hypothetical protein
MSAEGLDAVPVPSKVQYPPPLARFNSALISHFRFPL